jgi:hypothetical protein
VPGKAEGGQNDRCLKALTDRALRKRAAGSVIRDQSKGID